VLGPRLAWDWHDGVVPESAVLDDECYVETTYSFLLDRSQRPYGVRVGRGTSTYGGTMFDVGPHGTVALGRFCMTNGSSFVCDREITVGDYSLLGWNTVIMDCRRSPFDPDRRRAALTARPPEPSAALPSLAGGADAQPVRIGHAVWIPFDCVILPGVTIGDGAVVGARSVIAEDVEPWTVVAGNPARVVRRLEPPERIPEPPVWPA
jgi:acetyltransferase-like isoleucine patch superfamily enzyme